MDAIHPYENAQIAIPSQATVVATRGQVSSKLGEEAVILHLLDGIYYGLNPVGARIWNLVQSPVTVDHILQVLLDEYDVDAEQCRNDLFALLQLLAEKKLIAIHNEALSTT